MVAAELPAFIVEVPADTKNGDIASNIAMAGARTWHKAPKLIAGAILAHLPGLAGSSFARAERERERRAGHWSDPSVTDSPEQPNE